MTRNTIKSHSKVVAKPLNRRTGVRDGPFQRVHARCLPQLEAHRAEESVSGRYHLGRHSSSQVNNTMRGAGGGMHI